MVTFAGCIPALWLIERLGRRKMLLIGGAGEVICAIIAGLCGHFLLAPAGTPDDQLTTSNIRGGQLLVSFAIIQVLFFATFWGELAACPRGIYADNPFRSYPLGHHWRNLPSSRPSTGRRRRNCYQLALE